MKTNCKNCGAPVPDSGICEYCGTGFVSYDQFIPPALSPLSITLDAKQVGKITEEMIRNIDWRRTICGN